MNYFECADALQQGLYPLSLLPFRTIVQGNTALHLTRDPAMKTMSIEAIMERFNLLDLRGALADFLTQVDSQDSFHIGGHRISNIDSPLPFDNLQVWTKVQVQNCPYFHHIMSSLHKQSMLLLPWAPGPMAIPMLFLSIPTIAKCGHIVVLKVVSCISHAYSICIDWSKICSGHHIVQLQLIFRAVPSRRTPSAPGTDLFLTYV